MWMLELQVLHDDLLFENRLYRRLPGMRTLYDQTHEFIQVLQHCTLLSNLNCFLNKLEFNVASKLCSDLFRYPGYLRHTAEQKARVPGHERLLSALHLWLHSCSYH